MSAITDQIALLPKPNCAVSVNGNWLEDIVHGYRTSSVRGRNAIDMEITEVTIGNSNGSRYRRKRDQSRDLTVSFAITADDEQAVHKQSEVLQKALNDENSKFIFYDEQDVYFIGTVSSFSEEWINAAGSDYKSLTGEFTIHCADPYRHATTETLVTTNGLKGTNAVELNNHGTVPVPLTVEAYMWDGSKYLAYGLDKNPSTSFAYILGTATEIDSTTPTDGPSILIDQSFGSDPEWTVNAGILPPIDTAGTQTGTLYYSGGARAQNHGTPSGTSSDSWIGPSLSHIIPAQNGNYAKNWRVNYQFDFDTGDTANGGEYYGLSALTLADGGGDPVVSVVMVDSKDDTNTEVRAYIGRTKHILGTVPNNHVHVASGGSVTLEKIEDDIHIVYSIPKAVVSNVTSTATGGKTGKVELRGTAPSQWNSALACTYYAWFEETAVDKNSNTSTITWAANAWQSGSTRFSGTTRQHAGIINVWVNDTIVCSEYVPLVHQNDNNDHIVWESGWRTINVPHNSDGGKQTTVKIDFDPGVDDVGNSQYHWADGNPYSETLQLTKIDRQAANSDNSAGDIVLDKRYTAQNSNTSIRQLTWWTAAYGADYKEEKDSSGNVTSKSGHRRFKNDILRSIKVIRYADIKTVAKDHAAYFATGDTILVDCDTNVVKQNGTANLNFIDITSEPLMLYPGTHTLKVAVDNKTANRPPTLRINYREQWK